MSNFFLDKPLPSSEESEQALIGVVLLDNKKFDIIANSLTPEDFFFPRYRRMYEAMIVLHREGRSIDPIQIQEVWIADGIDPQGLGGINAITNATSDWMPPTHKSFLETIKTVRDKSLARQLLHTCNNTIQEILSESVAIQEIVQHSEGQVANISTLAVTNHKAEKVFSDLWEIVPEIRQQFENYHLGITNGVSTGMKEVDDKLDGGGLQPGGLYVVAAMEKAGKTSLALDWIYSISAEQGKLSLLVTGEMSKVAMAKRLYSAHSGIEYWKFRPGLYDSPLEATYTNAIVGLDDFGTIPIRIADKISTLAQIRRNVLRAVETGHKSTDPKKQVAVGLVDYLQLFGDDDIRLNDTARVEKVSRGLKMLATEAGIPIIVISSTNRIGYGEREVLDTDNLRQSGSIGFDAEALFFLQNPAYVPGKPYTPMPVTPMNLILARQRNGPTGTIPVMFIGPYMQFMTVKDYERRKGMSINQTIPVSAGQEIQAQKQLEANWQ